MNYKDYKSMTAENVYSMRHDNPGVLVTVCILSFLIIALCIVRIVNYNTDTGLDVIAGAGFSFIMAFLSIYYAAFGYQVPHGNFMKYLCLVYALYMAVDIVLCVAGDRQTVLRVIPSVIMVMCVSYMSGRLVKYKKNIVISAIVAVAAAVYGVACIVGSSLNIWETLGAFDKLVLWVSVALSYLVRFKSHKDAGNA